MADAVPSSPNLDERLDAVLADYLRAVRAGEAPERGRLLAAYPELAAELAEFFADQDRFDRAALPLRVAAGVGPPLPSAVGPHLILGEIARGGMGVVLRGRHRELGREVAVKLLLAGRHATAEERRRFRREAEASAALDHPNIVPIYDVGEQDGLPWFSMKLLPAALSAQLSALSPKHAADIVARVARAVHHAHQRGVLHRDLKPSNILLDEHGAPHVADFGLARRDGAGSLSASAILGTPAYMAPEQAAGKPGEVTVASDVYGLGAILYECLTGRPPFKGATAVDVLRQVLDREPERPGGDADLQTICLKCLEKDPARRYGSAAELADDLERYQRGEPIHARRLSPLGRGLRWARRQPVVAGLSAALTTAVVSALVAVSLLWQRAEAGFAEARQQRDDAQAALRQADESFRQAHAAVNAFCVTFSDELARAPGQQGLRRRLLHTARDYHRAFVRQRAGDPTLRRELADTHVRVAQITAAIGERRHALDAYREALAIYRELNAEQPADAVIQRKLAGTLANVATLQELGDGRRTSAEAIAAYERFAAARPDDVDLAAGLALALANHASQFIRVGRLDDALANLERAATEQERLRLRLPSAEQLQAELAATLHNLGVVYDRQGRRPESLCCYLRALALREALARSGDNRRQADLAAMQHHVGLALGDLGQRNASHAALQRALDLRRKVAAAEPLVTRYQIDLAVSLTRLGIYHNSEKRRDQAVACYDQARRTCERLVALDPHAPGLRKLLGEAWFNIGVTHGAMTRRPQEADALRQARALQEELVRASPENVEYRSDLGRTLNNLGINLWVRKHEREAKEVLHQAIASTRLLIEKAPRVTAYRRLLNNHYGLLAEIEWRQGNAAASAEMVLARQALWPHDPAELYQAGRELARAATVAPPGEQTAHLDRAMTALRRAAACGFRDTKKLREEPDLRLLRPRADFQALAATLAGE